MVKLQISICKKKNSFQNSIRIGCYKACNLTQLYLYACRKEFKKFIIEIIIWKSYEIL